ncbi:hypothetical protein GJAV_G00185430 [Gymnothorax javanicus]|nr:hypothetical protein GJAV_G00185430 [Gymnothorax javanicus]
MLSDSGHRQIECRERLSAAFSHSAEAIEVANLSVPCAMPERDSWPGYIAMDSVTSMDSAGSCDSVVSVNSAFSDDSLEYLSAEERACLMFLEETIESLEAEEDSGLSTDEREDRLPVPDESDYPHSDPTVEPDKHHKPSHLVQHLLALADRNSSIQPKDEVVTETEAEPISVRPTSLIDLPPDRVDLVHQPIDTNPDTDPCQSDQRAALSSTLLLIPPPTDFRDEPKSVVLRGGGTPKPKRPLSEADIMKILKRSVSKEEAKPSIETADDQSLDSSDSPPPFEPQLPAPLEVDELKSPPPAVAPKPKQLPPNIILKSHKGIIPSPVSSPDQSIGSSCTSPSDMVLMDPQKVRMEALRKLGLLKDDETDSGPTLSPRIESPKLRRSLEPSPSPLIPAHADFPQTDAPEALTSPTLPPAMETQGSRFRGEYRERSSSDLPSFIPSSRALSMGVKSATLERLGPSPSYTSMSRYSSDSDEDEPFEAPTASSLVQLRNARPRPVSLGNGRDFRPIQGDHPQTVSPFSTMDQSTEFGDSIQHLHSSDSPRFPRPQCVSVLINPHSLSDEDHREALRKLGLLED